MKDKEHFSAEEEKVKEVLIKNSQKIADAFNEIISKVYQEEGITSDIVHLKGFKLTDRANRAEDTCCDYCFPLGLCWRDCAAPNCCD